MMTLCSDKRIQNRLLVVQPEAFRQKCFTILMRKMNQMMLAFKCNHVSVDRHTFSVV
jgi:L-lysine 2,3-aminomutase